MGNFSLVTSNVTNFKLNWNQAIIIMPHKLSTCLIINIYFYVTVSSKPFIPAKWKTKLCFPTIMTKKYRKILQIFSKKNLLRFLPVTLKMFGSEQPLPLSSHSQPTVIINADFFPGDLLVPVYMTRIKTVKGGIWFCIEAFKGYKIKHT